MSKIVNWGGRLLCIEVNDEGIRVFDMNSDGSRIEGDTGQREIWIDPSRMKNGENMLQVHAYTDAKGTPNDGDQAPVTLNVGPDYITLVNNASDTLRSSGIDLSTIKEV